MTTAADRDLHTGRFVIWKHGLGTKQPDGALLELKKDMDMVELFDKIFQHFVTKREYLEIFSHKDHLSAMEHWFRGEIVWLMHQPPLREQGIFIDTCRSKKPGTGVKTLRPDLHLNFSGIPTFVELKNIIIGDPKWDYVIINNQLIPEFTNLLSMAKEAGENNWFMSVAYPLDDLSRWQNLIDKAAPKAGLHDYYVRNLSFDIGNGKLCVFSLFGLEPE